MAEVVRASKENAQRCLNIVDDCTASTRFPTVEEVQFMRDFLTKAKGKLPYEATYDRQKKVEDAAKKGFQGD